MTYAYNLPFSQGFVAHFMGETKIRNIVNKRELSSSLVERKLGGGGAVSGYPRLSVFGW